jgi:hypothetical protein
MTALDLEGAIDQLYSVDLSEFTSHRNSLAKELRGEGRRAAAEQVKELHKPTLAAWTVNQLARRNRREVDLLLDSGHRARDAQRGLLSGEERGGLEQALKTERRALQDLLGSARTILRERGSEPQPALLEKVSQTLRAAAVTDEGREALARGRLTEELEPAGFEAFAGVTPVRKPKRKDAQRSPEPRKRTELAEARDQLSAARARLRGLERQLKDAESAAGDLRDKLERAERSVEELRAEAGNARSDLDDAQRAVDRARRR